MKTRHTIYLQGIAWDITEQKRSQELLRLQRDLGIALSRASSLREMLDIVLDTVLQIEGVDCGGIYLVERETRIYRLAASRGLSPEGVEMAAVAHAGSAHGSPLRRRKADLFAIRGVRSAPSASGAGPKGSISHGRLCRWFTTAR